MQMSGEGADLVQIDRKKPPPRGGKGGFLFTRPSHLVVKSLTHGS